MNRGGKQGDRGLQYEMQDSLLLVLAAIVSVRVQALSLETSGDDEGCDQNHEHDDAGGGEGQCALCSNPSEGC